jgi:hypothetical protein
MKLEMRRALAREPFAEKMRKVEALLQLSAKLKARGALKRKKSHEDETANIHPDQRIISAIRHKWVLQFSYNGKLRTVEPQTYGLSSTGRELLRAYERPAGGVARRSGMAKLFDLKSMSGIQKSGEIFAEALPAHNPQDSAMVAVFATLPKPKKVTETMA